MLSNAQKHQLNSQRRISELELKKARLILRKYLPAFR